MTRADETDWIDVSVTVRHGMSHWPDLAEAGSSQAVSIEAAP